MVPKRGIYVTFLLEPIEPYSYRNAVICNQFVRFAANLLLTSLLATQAIAQTNPWKRVAPLPTSQTIQRIAFGGGVFVGVCLDGTLVRSKDGIAWVAGPKPAANVRVLDDIVFGNGTFVAVGVCDDEIAAIFTSKDGLSWTKRLAKNPNGSTLSSRLLSVTFGSGGFVAGGFASSVTSGLGLNETTLVSSANGVDWSRRPLTGFNHINSLAFGAGKYVGITSGSETWISSNGLSWTKNEISISGLSSLTATDITFGEGVFALVGSHSAGGLIATSTNGSTWTKREVPTTPTDFGFLQKIDYCGDRFLAFGSSSFAGVFILSSPTGATWTGFALDFPSATNVSGFVFGHDLYLAYGGNGTIGSSVNGSTFTRRAPVGNAVDLHDVAYGGGNFVAVGGRTSTSQYNVIQVSADAQTWQGKSSGLDSATQLTAIAYGNGRFVAVGGNTSLGRSGVATTSTTGSSWTGTTIGGGVTAMDTPNDLAFGAGLFAAVGPVGEVFTSTDGKNWTQRTTGISDTLTNIAWNGKRFVAIAQGTNGITSTNGINWEPITLEGAIGYNPNRLAASSSGGFVYVASNGMYRSTNGTSWAKVTDPTAPVSVLGSVAFANNQFVITPGLISGFEYSTFVSVNEGQSWSQSANTPDAATAIAAGEEKFVSVGSSGEIWVSKFSNPPPVPPEITSPDTAVGRYGKSFSYEIKTTPKATSFVAFNLPPGLKVNETTGVISGKPLSTGTFQVTLRATKAKQTGNKLLTLKISKAAQTLKIPEIPTKKFSTKPFIVGGTASSGLPLVVKRVSGPIKVTTGRVNGVTMKGLGTAKISFSQPGNENYLPVRKTITFKIVD